MKKFILTLVLFSFFSCLNGKPDEQPIEQNEPGDEDGDMRGDGYWRQTEGGRKVYEIWDADEFRQKLMFYNYETSPYKWKKEAKKAFRLDTDIGSIIYTTNEYLLKYNISSEKLMFSILDVFLGDIEEDYFSQIEVFYTDIYYGQFLFYYGIDTNRIFVRYYKAEGIDTYFPASFQTNNGGLTLSDAGHDTTGMEKMVSLCKIYSQIPEGKNEADPDDLIKLNITKEDMDFVINEFITNNDYGYIDGLLYQKIKDEFGYDDDVCVMVKNAITKYCGVPAAAS